MVLWGFEAVFETCNSLVQHHLQRSRSLTLVDCVGVILSSFELTSRGRCRHEDLSSLTRAVEGVRWKSDGKFGAKV